jgi:amylosucrase
LLLHSIILSIGGIPLIYLGDEVGTLNDYGYRSDPAKAKDSRWVHRPFADWVGRMARRSAPDAIEGRIFGELRRLIDLRKQHVALANGEMEIISTHNDHVFGYVRRYNGERLLALANFTEHEQTVAANEVRLHGLSYAFTDLVSEQTITLAEDIRLGPYQFVWLVGER